MIAVLDKLDKMVNLEIENGYDNKAVIGGLDGVLSWWPQQIRTACTQADQESIVERVIWLIQAYGNRNRTERARAVDEIKQKLVALNAAIEASEAVEPEVETPSAPSVQTTPLRSVPESNPEEDEDSPSELDSQYGSTEASRLGLNSPVTAIVGIGPTQATRLGRLGVRVIGDLLYFFPRRYDDYATFKPIGKLQYGDQVTIIGAVRATKTGKTQGGVPVVNTIVADASGVLQATWFNQPYLAKQFKRGRQIVLSGKVDEYLGRLVMSNPEWEPLESSLLHTGRIVPVYPLTKGLRPRWLRSLMRHTVEYWAKRLPDYLPAPIRERLDLMLLEDAVAQMHFPDSTERLAKARRRLSFDEFFVLQLGVLQQRQQWQSQPGMPIPIPTDTIHSFLADLPYELTQAQHRVLNDVLGDLATERPMSRLLQGDVGSGKTVVAVVALLAVAASGYQAAMMAPTEILSEQHFRNVSAMLADRGVQAALLTGSVPKAEKDLIYEGLASGEIDVVIGTHAVIQQDVQFKNLVLAIIDEQHRFGVRQRGLLRGKGYNPHILVMSATPIPRTLALTIYGDLDLSVIDEMPPGRQPIKTRWFMPVERERAYRFLHAQVEQGRQAYIICPLVEESDKIEAKAAVEEYERLKNSIFPDLRLGLLHGRLRGEEKERVMHQFSEHELDILVSTSVIEVGIDVPNATVMMIEGANRFGLSQLHQFRGRVGRGEHESYCILLADAAIVQGNDEAQSERLRAIEGTSDGFVLAEKDLEMRGPGDFFGTRQSGLPELKLASLADTPLLELARREAQALFALDPKLALPDHRLLARKVSEFWGGEGDLS